MTCDVTCFSLAPTKILGAYGDAGIITTDNRETAVRLRVLRNYGHSLDMGETIDGVLGTRGWKMVAEGFNERLDTLQAAILRAKLPTLEQRIARRRAVAARYNELLDGLDIARPYEADNVRHVYRAYTILIDDRDQVRDCLAAQGIATRTYYIPPLHLQPVYEDLGFRPDDFPVAEETSAKRLSLPIFPEITEEQIEEVVSVLERCLSLT